MFSVSAARRASSYSAFLKQTAGAAKFEGLVGGPRGKAVGKAYRALPAAEKKRLTAVGKTLRFPKKIHGHSGFQFYMKTNPGIIDENAKKWVRLTAAERRSFRTRGKHVPVVKRSASKPPHMRRPLSINPWAAFLRRNKKAFKGCTGRQALTITKKLAKTFKKTYYKK